MTARSRAKKARRVDIYNNDNNNSNNNSNNNNKNKRQYLYI